VDSRARVEAALSGGETDRPPVGAWGHTHVEEWSPEQLAEVTIKRARRFGWDFVKFQPRATFFAEAFGARFRPSGDPLTAPIAESEPVTDLESWRRLSLVDDGVMREQARALGLVTERLGDRVPVLQTVFSPISVAAYLVGRDREWLARELRERPEVMVSALERIADALIDFSRASVAAGAAGIFYAISGFATPDLIPYDAYERLLLPMDRRVLGSLPSEAWFNVLHLCGPRQYFQLAEHLPVQAVSYSIHEEGNPPLAEARELTGRAVMGGVEQRRLLVTGPPEEIVRQVQEAVTSTGGRGLLVAPGCSVPPGAPTAHLEAMVKAVRT
jgi:uroporphyrinogen decarboxylase